MINITTNEYDMFRVACPRCNNSIFNCLGNQYHDRYCKKCSYRAGFYHNRAVRMLNYEEWASDGTRRFMIRVIYPEQVAEITVLPKGIFSPGETREQYRKPLKDEYFDDRCLIRIEAIDDITTLFRKMTIMR